MPLLPSPLPCPHMWGSEGMKLRAKPLELLPAGDARSRGIRGVAGRSQELGLKRSDGEAQTAPATCEGSRRCDCVVCAYASWKTAGP